MLNARGASLLLVRKARLAEGEPRCGVTARDGRAATPQNLPNSLLPFSRRLLSRFLRGDTVPPNPQVGSPRRAVPTPNARLSCAPSVMLRARGAVPLLD